MWGLLGNLSMAADEQDKQDEAAAHTIPVNLKVTVRGFESELANNLAHRVVAELAQISTHVDLSCLDGVTIACDYEDALRELDRGYKSSHELTPSRDWAYGIAMTPGVLRDGQHRSHMVLNAAIVTPLVDDLVDFEQGFSEDEAFHLLAHEAAHVEVSAVFDKAFPEFLLRKEYSDWFEATQWDVILACWDEYAVCRIVGRYGNDPLPGYIETFLHVLSQTENEANRAIKTYRTESNLDETITEVCRRYSVLMKSYAYMIGAMASAGQTIEDHPEASSAINGSYFENTSQALMQILDRLFDDYCRWPDQAIFLEIGGEFEAFLARQGMTLERYADGQIYVHFPYSPQTMPSLDESLQMGNGLALMRALAT